MTYKRIICLRHREGRSQDKPCVTELAFKALVRMAHGFEYIEKRLEEKQTLTRDPVFAEGLNQGHTVAHQAPRSWFQVLGPLKGTRAPWTMAESSPGTGQLQDDFGKHYCTKSEEVPKESWGHIRGTKEPTKKGSQWPSLG